MWRVRLHGWQQICFMYVGLSHFSSRRQNRSDVLCAIKITWYVRWNRKTLVRRVRLLRKKLFNNTTSLCTLWKIYLGPTLKQYNITLLIINNIWMNISYTIIMLLKSKEIGLHVLFNLNILYWCFFIDTTCCNCNANYKWFLVLWLTTLVWW